MKLNQIFLKKIEISSIDEEIRIETMLPRLCNLTTRCGFSTLVDRDSRLFRYRVYNIYDLITDEECSILTLSYDTDSLEVSTGEMSIRMGMDEFRRRYRT